MISRSFLKKIVVVTAKFYLVGFLIIDRRSLKSMVKNYSADYILPVSAEPVKNGIVSRKVAEKIYGIK